MRILEYKLVETVSLHSLEYFLRFSLSKETQTSEVAWNCFNLLGHHRINEVSKKTSHCKEGLTVHSLPPNDKCQKVSLPSLETCQTSVQPRPTQVLPSNTVATGQRRCEPEPAKQRPVIVKWVAKHSALPPPSWTLRRNKAGTMLPQITAQIMASLMFQMAAGIRIIQVLRILKESAESFDVPCILWGHASLLSGASERQEPSRSSSTNKRRAPHGISSNWGA